MALIASLGALCATAVFAFLCTALGHRLLRAARLDLDSDTQRLLCSAAIGFIVFEAAFALAEFAAPARICVAILLVATAALGAPETRAISRALSQIFHRLGAGSRSERFLAALVALVLLLEGLAAMAPMTGSDALHYHFAAPLRVLRSGFHPDFFLTTGFLTGQAHLLILSGLALGSEKLAMGLLFLPGALAAAAAACLARAWLAPQWAWLVALSFLLNPVIFWQISAAGAPDLWMAFFVVVSVLLIARARANASYALACLGGLLAGAVAGTKYIGCLFAAALLLAFLWESRSLKLSAVFLAAAVAAGIWPYARNFLWTGDPIFPFAMRWLAPAHVNAYSLAAVLESTVASSQRTLAAVWRFPLFAAVDRSNAGFWEFFGPLCLAFIPLFFLRVERSARWRVSLVVLLAGGLGEGLASGMARYALPLFPVALAAAFAGAASVATAQWKVARAVVAVSVAGFLLLGAGGFAVYSMPALRATIGGISREDYLLERSPDYAVSTFVNRALAGQEHDHYALVLFRHTYYLRVPYLYGDPDDSWAIDPARLTTAESWREFLRSNRIRWVVRAPDYPEAIAAPLEQLERSGALAPVAREDVATFEGMRILGVRKTVPAIIFRVSD